MKGVFKQKKCGKLEKSLTLNSVTPPKKTMTFEQKNITKTSREFSGQKKHPKNLMSPQKTDLQILFTLGEKKTRVARIFTVMSIQNDCLLRHQGESLATPPESFIFLFLRKSGGF